MIYPWSVINPRSVRLLALSSYGLFFSVLTMAQTAQAASVSPQNSAPITELSALPSLPNPLSLEYLLSEFPLSSPKIALQQSLFDQASAQHLHQQIPSNFQASLDGRLGWREFAQETQDHHLLALHIGKVLYDFNQTDLQVQSAQRLVQAESVLLDERENQQRLAVMQAFFNVLLSDFQYRIDNEAMAVEYVGFDKIKDRHKIGQLSDIELLAAENRYQAVLVKRMASEQRQLQTRLQLANLLGQPQARPDELRFPRLQEFARRDIKGLVLKDVQAEVLQNNAQLKALSDRVAAQQLALESTHSVGAPTVRADAWAGQLSSHPEVRDGHWRAAVSVAIPLYDGGAKQAAMAMAQAKLANTRAQYQQAAQQLSDEVSDLYFQLTLLHAEKKQHQVFGDYADLYLDYSRALYENETATDLGDSMVRLSQANYNMVAWQFKQALLWAQLDYLTGKRVHLTTIDSKTPSHSAFVSIKQDKK